MIVRMFFEEKTNGILLETCEEEGLSVDLRYNGINSTVLLILRGNSIHVEAGP